VSVCYCTYLSPQHGESTTEKSGADREHVDRVRTNNRRRKSKTVDTYMYVRPGPNVDEIAISTQHLLLRHHQQQQQQQRAAADVINTTQCAFCILRAANTPRCVVCHLADQISFTNVRYRICVSVCPPVRHRRHHRYILHI